MPNTKKPARIESTDNLSHHLVDLTPDSYNSILQTQKNLKQSNV